jgi:hypothetical protein
MAELARDGVAHAGGQHGQAAGPGQHRAFARIGGVPVAAGEIVQAGPGRHRVVPRAVVVAAAVVQVPVQRPGGIAFAFQPLFERDGVQRAPGRVARRQRERNAEDFAAVAAGFGAQAFDPGEKAPVLGQFRLGQAGHGQQAVFPAAAAQQPLLRRVRQHGLVIVGADLARAALDDAEVGQHLAHVGRRQRRQRQVVRAQRVIQAAAPAGGRVAAELGALHHDEIGVAFARQLPRAGQARDAGPQDRHAVPAALRRLRPGRAVAQGVAGLHAGVVDVGRGLDDARPPIAGAAGGRGRGRAQQEAAAAHQRMTWRQSSSK